MGPRNKGKKSWANSFFKSKHIAQPYLTMSDALILIGENLCNALSGKAPNSNATASTIKQLMEIYKKNTEKEQTNVDAQRVKRTVAQAQRAEGEAKRDTKARTRTYENEKCFVITLKSGPPWRTVVRRVTRRLDTMEYIEDIDVDSTVEDALLHRSLPEDVVGTQTTLYHQNISKADTAGEEDELPAETENEEPEVDILDNLMVQGLEVAYPEQSEDEQAVLVVTQEEGPSQNTTSRNRLLTTVEMSGSCPTANQAAKRQYPLKFLTDYAGAVLDQDTGEPLEYRQLIKKTSIKRLGGTLLTMKLGAWRKAC